MRTIWHSLVWKEWHEHKWKLAAIAAIVAGSIALVSGTWQVTLVSSLQYAILLSVISAALFVGMSTAAGERARGTLPFLLALPASPRKFAITKLAFGLATCLVPALGAVMLLFGWYLCWDWLGVDYSDSLRYAARELDWPSGHGNWFLAMAALLAVWVLGLVLWTAAAGVRRPDEVSAAAVSLAVMLGVWVVLWPIANNTYGPFADWIRRDGSWLAALAKSAAPAGLVTVRFHELSWPLVAASIALFAVVQAGLAARYVRQFGRVADSVRSPQAAVIDATQLQWLGPPRPSAIASIAWKQFRESGPIVLVGLSGTVAIGLAMAVSVGRDFGAVILLGSFFAGMYFGAITSLVVGIGVFLRDLEPRLHTFWRSRPISPDAWFWTKFITGLAVVLVAFQLPMLLVPAMVPVEQLSGDFETPRDILRAQGISLVVFVSVYTAAVAATCLVRHAVYAAVLSIAALWAMPMLTAFTFIRVQWLLGREFPADFWDSPASVPVWLAGFAIVAVAATLLGWLAVRYDWGRRSRY